MPRFLPWLAIAVTVVSRTRDAPSRSHPIWCVNSLMGLVWGLEPVARHAPHALVESTNTSVAWPED